MIRIVSWVLEFQDLFTIHKVRDLSILYIDFKSYPLIAVKGSFNIRQRTKRFILFSFYLDAGSRCTDLTVRPLISSIPTVQIELNTNGKWLIQFDGRWILSKVLYATVPETP